VIFVQNLPRAVLITVLIDGGVWVEASTLALALGAAPLVAVLLLLLLLLLHAILVLLDVRLAVLGLLPRVDPRARHILIGRLILVLDAVLPHGLDHHLLQGHPASQAPKGTDRAQRRQ
jgi:hypothetical protein